MACYNTLGQRKNGLPLKLCLRGKVVWQREFPRAQFMRVCDNCYTSYYKDCDNPPDKLNYPEMPNVRPEFQNNIRDVFHYIRMSQPEWKFIQE